MQISDKLGQYNRNVKNGTEELRSAQGTQKLVSSAGDLAAGNVFEGTVNSIKNGRVTLALGDGQVITARLDGKVGLQPGSSMFFQVKSNDGVTVAIRPYAGAGNIGNPILLNALTAAQIPVTERSLAMVDMMMKEQMPIDRQSILNMTKVLSGNPQVNVGTLVQMTKMGLPVTPEMAAQFENYLSDRGAILNELDTAMNQLTAALGNENLSSSDAFTLHSQIIDILRQEGAVQEGAASAGGKEEPVFQKLDAVRISGNDGEINGLPGNGEHARAGEINAGTDTPPIQGANGDKGSTSAVQPSVSQDNIVNADTNGVSGSIAANAGAEMSHTAGMVQNTAGATLGELLNETQLSNLTKLLQNVPTLAGNPEIFMNTGQEEIFVDTMQDDEMGAAIRTQLMNQIAAGEEAVVNKNLTPEAFLQEVTNALAANSQYGFSGIKKLFAGKEYQMLLKNAMEQQWTLKPQDLKEEHKVSRLYEKMVHQMDQMENVMKLAGVSQNSFSRTASDIRNNIEFMNQINQMYAYIQVPLKLSGQNANSDLYVYTNKKNLSDPGTELTAFLHLDLEQLGTTDVSIKMKNKQVTSNFYLSDQVSFQLVEKHLPILEKRLKQKGYNCSITITNEEKKVNLVEDFLKKDMPHAGKLHRYSFDVRA